MGKANGAGVHLHRNGMVGTVDGPQPDQAIAIMDAMAKLQAEHLPKIREQDARFNVRIEAMGTMNVVRFALLNKHVDEIEPTAIYVPLANLLHLVGQYLVGTSGVGGTGE
jgi:hypothetical protein